MQKFFDVDFDSIYPTPTPYRIAEAYFNRLWRKLHIENFSLLITFYGRHRVGKSLAAVDFAYVLDPTFEPNLEKRVVYNGKQLIDAFTEIRQQNIRGAAVIVDEAGSGELSSQRWYEDAAKIISAELQAVGYLNPFVGFVTQSFSFINTTARRLSQGVFEVDRTHNKFNTVKPFWVENNPWISSTYRKYPIFCEKHGDIVSNVFKIKQIKLGITPSIIKARYDAHSQAYKDQLLESSKEELQTIDRRKDQKRAYISGIDAIAKEVYENVHDYMSYNKRGTKQDINEDLIRHRHGIKTGDARLVKELVRQQLRPSRHQRNQASKQQASDDVGDPGN